MASRTDSNLLSPPTSAYFNVRSESENNLLSPPPPRSAVFAGYNDPTSAHSTRSLPTHPISHSRTASKELADLNADHSNHPAPPKQSKGGLFSWAQRERKKSKAPPPPSPSAPSPMPDISLASESFNLRSFRHVRPESPSSSPPSPLPPVRPRPREGSFVSDSSHRISVAAFREAQARRSAANSPVPSFSHDPLSPGSSAGLRPPSTLALRNSRSVSGESDPDESEEEEEESEASSTLKPQRHRSAKQQNSPPVPRPAGKSVSELGHRTMRPSAPPVAPPRMTTSTSANPSFAPSSSPRESAFARPLRARASASTSALSPSAAARRASVLAQQQQTQQPRNQPQAQGKFGTPLHMLLGSPGSLTLSRLSALSPVSALPCLRHCKVRSAEGPFSSSPLLFIVIVFKFLIIGFRRCTACYARGTQTSR